MTHDTPDSQLVQRVQAGEVDAFEPLVERYQKPIFNLLYRWLGDDDDAAEAAQEVFLSAFRAVKQFRGEAKFSTWLYQIAVNQARNRRKGLAIRNNRMVPLAADDPDQDGEPAVTVADPAPNPLDNAQRQELTEQLQHGLDRLDADEALMILLHDLQGMAYEEMATVLKIPLGTVKSRLHRARQALKRRVAPMIGIERTVR
jgi:RNA polymerase sigma-70 factor, ECF subfamily